MNKRKEIKITNNRNEFSRKIGEKAARKIKAQRNSTKDIWFGLGMMGLIGWSVVVPTLLGAAFGIWLDNHHHGSYSWTLMLLIIGLGLGCLNAWYWVKKEEKEMRDNKENEDE
jgi:ATP synthase protein I